MRLLQATYHRGQPQNIYNWRTCAQLELCVSLLRPVPCHNKRKYKSREGACCTRHISTDVIVGTSPCAARASTIDVRRASDTAARTSSKSLMSAAMPAGSSVSAESRTLSAPPPVVLFTCTQTNTHANNSPATSTVDRLGEARAQLLQNRIPRRVCDCQQCIQ